MARACHSVVLRHTLADGSAHLDWMIERPDTASGLITFRLASGTDLSCPGSTSAERISDHRREYLDYEGAVSGGRGRVERLAKYGIREFDESDSRIRVVLEETVGGGRRWEWTGEREIGPRWIFLGVVC